MSAGPSGSSRGGAPPAPSAAAPPPVHRERRQRAVGWRSRDALRIIAMAAGMYILIKLLWFANQLALAVFLGVLFGLAMSSGVDRLERFRIPRGVGAALIAISFFGLLTGFGAWMAPTLREQGTELRRKLPEAIDRAEGWVESHRGGVIGLVFRGLGTEARIDSAATVRRDTTTPVARDTTTAARDTTVLVVAPPTQAQGGGAQPAATGAPGRLSDRIGAQFSGLTRYLFPFLTSTFTAIGGALLVIFLAIYIAADPELYHRGIMHLFVHRHRERAGDVLSAMAAVLRRWLVTQLIAMAAIAAVTTIVLLSLGVKAAFALGLIAGLLEFIPTIGPLLSALPAIAMGFLDSPEKAAAVAIAYFGIQFLENHLLIPLLMKGGVDLPPALTVLAQALMAMIFGFLGLMCAVPLLAASMVMVKMLYVEGVVGDDAFGPDDNPYQGVE